MKELNFGDIMNKSMICTYECMSGGWIYDKNVRIINIPDDTISLSGESREVSTVWTSERLYIFCIIEGVVSLGSAAINY